MSTDPSDSTTDGGGGLACFHCTLPVSGQDGITAQVGGELRQFCCNGCRAVCEAIYEAGLEGFYQRTPDGLRRAPPPELPKELALYDLDEVQEEFVDALGDVREINLLIEGIHCAACVWLIENTLRGAEGVVDGRVNLSGRRLHLKWDNSQVNLSSLLQRLGAIGYAAVPFDPEAAEGALQRRNRDLLYRMGFAAFGMMNLLWISIALYSGADHGEFRSLFHWVGFGLATPTLLYSGYPFFKGAWTGLRSLHLGMDLPIAIGASITYLYSLYATITGTGHVYWDTVVNFLFVILVGRYLESISKRQAVASTQRLLDLQPKVATVVREGKERLVSIRGVRAGDHVLIRPGERVPVDGVVLSGEGDVDESMLTGESRPVKKGAEDRVSAGTMNGRGVLTVEVGAVMRETALGRIIRLVEDAQASKAPIQCVADRIVPWFVAVTIGLATSTFLLWFQSDFEIALMAATAVLIITCPCAFGLATPMSIAVASGLGAKYGILVRNGAVLETLSGIDHILFDKTGTLTEGRVTVTSVFTDTGGAWRPEEEEEEGDDLPDGLRGLVADLAAVERYSEHPVAVALLELAKRHHLPTPGGKVEDFVYRPGYGISATIEGRSVVVGNGRWLVERGIMVDGSFVLEQTRLEAAGVGYLNCAVEGRLRAVIGVEDRIREDAPALIAALKREGMEVTLLSGDRRHVAEEVAARLGGGMRVIAEVMPEQKDEVIRGLQQGGRRVAMVGDGVNDAPALVRADIGIALGSGTDVSIASADIVLISNELARVRDAIALSRRTLRTIRQNIGISITYNVIMVPLAMAALVTPLVAAISMPISSLLVIGNAARIRTLFRRSA